MASNIPLKEEAKYSSLAQSVEHAAVNRVVVGSSPTRGAKTKKTSNRMSFLFCFYDAVLNLLQQGLTALCRTTERCEVGS